MLATGIAKQLRYKAESSWAVPPGASGAQLLRRVQSTLALKKATFQSNELVSTYQLQDFRHGPRTVDGAINGELSPGTWEDFIAAALRRLFTAVTASSGLSITITGAGPTYNVARSAGSWLTDGAKIGMVGRFTAGTFNALNSQKNLVFTAVTALNLTVMTLNGSALFAEGPIATATMTYPGKVTFVPQTGHTDTSFSIEHYHADLVLSERFDGCKINQMDVGLPPSGIGTINSAFIGRDMTPGVAAYYTAPTAESTSGLLAASNGLLIAQGAAIAVVTSLNFSVKGNMVGEGVIGSNLYADITEGRVMVDGQFTALFDSATIRDYFLNETEVSLAAVMPASPAANAEFMSFVLPRVKLGAADKDDGDKALVQTCPFTALENVTGGAGVSSERTTVWVQDSLA